MRMASKLVEPLANAAAHHVIRQTMILWRKCGMQRLIQTSLVVMCVTCSAYGDFVDIEVMSVVPPSPTPSDAITLEVAGTFYHSLAQSIQRAPWQRVGNDIQVDLLVIELPIRAPSIPGPFEQAVDLGLLPVGEYDVTARTFVTYPGPFADPWLFPDEFNGARPVDTLEYRFAVIPEPSTLTFTTLGLLGLVACSRRRKR
jgi:hypothetical protein